MSWINMPHTLKNAVHVSGMCGKPEKKQPWCPCKWPGKNVEFLEHLWDVLTYNFDDFHKISYNSLNSGPEIMFLDSFWGWRVGRSRPVPVTADIFTCDPYRLPEPMPWVFCTSQDICICIAYFSGTFTHQIIRVHPRDSPEIPHFSRVIYPDTRVASLRVSAHPWDMYCFFTCVGHIYSGHLPINLFVYIPQMLWKLQIFPEYLPGHKLCIFPGNLPENHDFPAIYMDSRVTSLLLSIGPNHYL